MTQARNEHDAFQLPVSDAIPLAPGLALQGVRRRFARNEEIFGEGEPAELLWILLEGTIELTRVTGGEVTVVTTMSTPGQWAGGLQAWGADAGYRATGHAVGNGRCLVLPSSDLKRLVGEWFPHACTTVDGGHALPVPVRGQRLRPAPDTARHGRHRRRR